MSKPKLKGSVGTRLAGRKGPKVRNAPDDVLLVRAMLSANGYNVSETGKYDKGLQNAIDKFQKAKIDKKLADGVVDPGGSSYNALLPKYLKAAKAEEKEIAAEEKALKKEEQAFAKETQKAEADAKKAKKEAASGNSAQKYTFEDDKGKTYGLTEKEKKELEKAVLTDMKLLAAKMDRKVKEAEALYKYYQRVQSGAEGWAMMLVAYQLKTTTAKIDPSIYSEGVNQVHSFCQAVEKGDFKAMGLRLKKAGAAADAMIEMLYKFRNDANLGAKAKIASLKGVATVCATAVGICASITLAPVAAAAVAGGYAACQSAAKSASKAVNGVGDGIGAAAKDIGKAFGVNFIAAGAASKIVGVLIPRVAGALAGSVAKTAAARGLSPNMPALTKLIEGWLKGAAPAMEAVVGNELQRSAVKVDAGRVPAAATFEKSVMKEIDTGPAQELQGKLKTLMTTFTSSCAGIVKDDLGPWAVTAQVLEQPQAVQNRFGEVMQKAASDKIAKAKTKELSTMAFGHAVSKAKPSGSPDDLVSLGAQYLNSDKTVAKIMLDAAGAEVTAMVKKFKITA